PSAIRVPTSIYNPLISLSPAPWAAQVLAHAAATAVPSTAREPLTGQLTRPCIRLEYRVERFDSLRRLRVQHGLDHTCDIGEADAPLQESLHRHLVGRIEHRRRTAPNLRRLAGQAQTGKALLVRTLEIQATDGEQVQRRYPRLDT